MECQVLKAAHLLNMLYLGFPFCFFLLPLGLVGFKKRHVRRGEWRICIWKLHWIEAGEAGKPILGYL